MKYLITIFLLATTAMAQQHARPKLDKPMGGPIGVTVTVPAPKQVTKAASETISNLARLLAGLKAGGITGSPQFLWKTKQGDWWLWLPNSVVTDYRNDYKEKWVTLALVTIPHNLTVPAYQNYARANRQGPYVGTLETIEMSCDGAFGQWRFTGYYPVFLNGVGGLLPSTDPFGDTAGPMVKVRNSVCRER